MNDYEKKAEDIISFDRCRSLHKRKERELRSRGLVGALIAGLLGFWLGYTIRDREFNKCLVPGNVSARIEAVDKK